MTGEGDSDQDAPNTDAQAPADGVRVKVSSSSDWGAQTTQRALPKELLDAMRHPDVPGVVLDAITQRATPAPGDVSDARPETFADDTARYKLSAIAASARDAEDSLAAAWVLGIVCGIVVVAWLVVGLLHG